jgi:hypothetical protein
MSIAYVSATLDASMEQVWSVLGDYRGIDRRARWIRAAEAGDGAGPAVVGSACRLTMEPDGRVVLERLLHYGAFGHRYCYEFAEQPFPVRADRGTVDKLTGQFTRIYAEFLDDLRNHVAGVAK